MAKKLNDASIATITSLNNADYMNTVNPSTGELSKITVANVKASLGGGGALVYAAILNQAGTAAPTATVVANTTGATIAFSRNSAGDFNATASAAIFTSGKTLALVTNGSPNAHIAAIRFSATVILIQAGTFTTPTDGAITGASFKIEIYP